MSLSPPPRTVKHTGQQSGGELFEMFKFRSFLQSKSVNYVRKLLQLPGNPDPLAGLCPRAPLGYLGPPGPGGLAPQMKIAVAFTVHSQNKATSVARGTASLTTTQISTYTHYKEQQQWNGVC